MKLYEFHAPLVKIFLISLKQLEIRINGTLDLLRSIHLLELLKLIPLLVLFGLLVKLIDLSKVELRVKIIRVDESSLRVVSIVILSGVNLGTAHASAFLEVFGNKSPYWDQVSLEHQRQEDQANVEATVQNHVKLAHSFLGMVLVIESDPGSNRIRLEDQWVSIDVGGESKMQNDRKWQKLNNTVTKLLGEVNCLSVVIED